MTIQEAYALIQEHKYVYMKVAHPINYIQLNFIVVRPGVTFEEVITPSIKEAFERIK